MPFWVTEIVPPVGFDHVRVYAWVKLAVKVVLAEPMVKVVDALVLLATLAPVPLTVQLEKV